MYKKRAEPIGKTIDAIRKLLKPWLGEPIWKITQRSAKLIYKYESIEKTSAKLKIEINTTEHLQVLPLKYTSFTMESKWFSGTCDIITYELAELMATKLRALYQRRKGRDLFDAWYVFSLGLVGIEDVLDIFYKYCNHEGIMISRELFKKNLEQKRVHKDFSVDMSVLLPRDTKWDFAEAFNFVQNKVITCLD